MDPNDDEDASSGGRETDAPAAAAMEDGARGTRRSDEARRVDNCASRATWPVGSIETPLRGGCEAPRMGPASTSGLPPEEGPASAACDATVPMMQGCAQARSADQNPASDPRARGDAGRTPAGSR
jgi:hypothetical protein